MLLFNPLADPCLSCGLWINKKHPCIRPPEKNLTTGGIVLIGEAPGGEEDARGEAFVGPAGSILRDALHRLGITPSGLVNAVGCRPVKGNANRAPTAREVSSCSAFLRDSLERLSPKLVICLGLTAAKAFGLSGKMRDLRNKEWRIDRHTWIARVGPLPRELGGEEDSQVRVGEGTVHVDVTNLSVPPVEALEGPRIDPYCPAYVTYHPAASMRPGQKHLAQVMEEDIGLYLRGSLRDPKTTYTEPEPTRRPHLTLSYHESEEKSMSDFRAPMPPYLETAMDEEGAVYFPGVLKPDSRIPLTNEPKCEIISLESKKEMMVVDIETDGFLKDKDPFFFGDKGREIWVVGTDRGNVDGYVGS